MALMPPQEQPPPSQQPPPGAEQPAPHGEGELDEREVQVLDDKSFQLIYGGKSPNGQVNPPIAEMLRTPANEPVQALANTASQVTSQVLHSAASNNVTVDPAAAFASMMNMVGELATVAGDEGIYDFQQNEIDAAAVQAGESLYTLTQDMGMFPQDEAMRDAGELVQASQSGEMDQAIGYVESVSGVMGQQPSGGSSDIGLLAGGGGDRGASSIVRARQEARRTGLLPKKGIA